MDVKIETLLSGMTLEHKVGQMMLASFKVWKEVPQEGSEENTTVQNPEQTEPTVDEHYDLTDEILYFALRRKRTAIRKPTCFHCISVA